MNSALKFYHGRRRETPGPSVVVDDGSGSGRILRFQGQALDWRWGRDTPPSERLPLARAILDDLSPNDSTPNRVAEFERRFIAHLPEEGFTIGGWQIADWLQSQFATR